MTFYQFLEIAATLIECILTISVITRISGKKFSSVKHIALILGLSTFLTIIVSYINSIEAFSFATIGIAIIYTVALTKITSTGKLLLRLTACILVMFFLHTLDYVIGFSSALLVAQSQDVYRSFDTMMQPGITRTVYTIVNKSIQTALFFLLIPVYSKLRSLSRRYQWILFSVTTASYIVMSVLLNLIRTDSLIVMQFAIIVSWLFIMICIIAIIVTIMFSTRYHEERRENEMVFATNELMEKNYLNMRTQQLTVAKQVHDFTNHMRTLEGMINVDTSAKEYLSELLAETSGEYQLCCSGNDVIDAVINCKASEAAEIHAAFSYHVQLPERLNISSIDLCAVLANQIDNALEACKKIPQESERIIEISIWQRQSFLFFRVENSVLENPFNEKQELISTKDPSGLHGLGLKNIRDTVCKNGGALENVFQGNQFISVAMMQNTV